VDGTIRTEQLERPSNLPTNITCQPQYVKDHCDIGLGHSSTEIGSSSDANPKQLLSADPSVLKVPAIVDNASELVIFPLYPGTDACSLAPVFAVEYGYDVLPTSVSTVELSRPVTYHVSANGSIVATLTLESVQMRSPALPGLCADPNIVALNGLFYVYTTTDGAPGCGGKTVYGWKSRDIWKRRATTGDPEWYFWRCALG
jgi:hypothetical protein